MINLFYRTIAIGVYSAPDSARYAAPMLGFFFLAAAGISRFDLQSAATAALAALSLGLVTPFLVATLRVMLHPEDSQRLLETLRWRASYVDFLVFGIFSLVLVGGLVFAVSGIAVAVTDYIEAAKALETQPTDQGVQQFGYGAAAVKVLLSGAQVMVGAAALLALVLWIYFFRILMCLPALADGFYLSSGEALEIAGHYRMTIFVVSVVLNAGLLGFMSLWRMESPWLMSLAAAGCCWLFLHANMALATAMYQIFLQGYEMRKLRS